MSDDALPGTATTAGAPADTIVWTRGGTAWVESLRDIHPSVVSTVAYPPGAPVEGTLDAPGMGPLRFTLKVTGSRQRDDRWVVSGRIISPTNLLRGAFLAAVSPRTPG